VALAVTGAGGLAVACGGIGDQGPMRDTEALRGTTVEYWNSQGPTTPAELARKRIFEGFNATNPYSIKVDLAAAASQGTANLEKTLGALAAGNPPDLIAGFNFNLSQMYAKGGLVAVDAELKGDAEWRKVRPSIFPNTLNSHIWKGTLFDLPTHNSIFQMYYHRGLLQRAGLGAPPQTGWTWDRFLEYGRKAITPEVSGYDVEFTYSSSGLMMLNNGARFFSPDGTKFQYTGVEVQETVEWELQLSRSGFSRPHDGTATGGYKEFLPEGKVVFQRAVANRVPTYKSQALQFGTCAYPMGPKNTSRTSFSHGDTQGLGVFKKDSKKVQAALLAALAATRPEGVAAFAENGLTAVYRHVVDSAEFKARWQTDAEQWPFYAVQANFHPYPSFPGFDELRSTADARLKDIWAGKTSVRDGLAEIQRLGQQLLDQALRGA
jgi:ABC-type glycerol-3-phosphate transport system substrate-binding protein